MEFASLELLAAHLREQLEQKKYILLFAYNGTGNRFCTAAKNC